MPSYKHKRIPLIVSGLQSLLGLYLNLCSIFIPVCLVGRTDFGLKVVFHPFLGSPSWLLIGGDHNLHICSS